MDDGFGPDHLPYGVFRPAEGRLRVGARLGDAVIDVGRVVEAPDGALDGPTLNPLLRAGPAVWRSVRDQLREAVAAGAHERALRPLSDVQVVCPLDPPDYVDFYSSLEHATNLGRILRPDGEALLPNWRHLPVGYHGRSASLVPSGAGVRRPGGQLPPAEPRGAPRFGPTERLDFELELGFVTGDGPPLGTPIAIDDWRDHVFGVCLVNDWSARDLQRWEYQPLGPFLSKSFATSVARWITPLAALEAHRAPARRQEPDPLPYLRAADPAAYDIELQVALAPAGGPETVISTTNARGLYWTIAQQIAHVSVNGAAVRAGDLYASGTISGADPGTYGSLIELADNGRRPVALSTGGERAFLADGDTVTLRGRAGGGGPPVTLGEVTGTVLPAAS